MLTLVRAIGDTVGELWRHLCMFKYAASLNTMILCLIKLSPYVLLLVRMMPNYGSYGLVISISLEALLEEERH